MEFSQEQYEKVIERQNNDYETLKKKAEQDHLKSEALFNRTIDKLTKENA